MKWLIFFVYWISLVYTMRQGDLWMWIILLPTFLLVYSWAEEQDDYTGPASQIGANGPAVRDNDHS